MRVLLIDTSGPYSLAAVTEGEQLLGSCTARGRPAAQIHELIRRLLPTVDMSLNDIEHVGVTTGPGSWTGLNIGVTAAKVLAQVQQCSVIPVSVLDALAIAQNWDKGRVWGICKAHRKRVYFSVYGVSSTGRPELPSVDSGVIAFDSFQNRLCQEVGTPLVVEYGQAFATSLSNSETHNYISRERLLPEGMLMAVNDLKPLQQEQVMALVPDYMQPSLAERDIKTS